MVTDKTTYLTTMKLIYGKDSSEVKEFKKFLNAPDTTDEEADIQTDQHWQKFLHKEVTVKVTMEDLYNIITACDGNKVLLRSYMRNYTKGSNGYNMYKEQVEEADAIYNRCIQIRDNAIKELQHN